MTVSDMYRAFGSRGVVAYSCKIVDSVLEGGVVIAVQNEGVTDTTEIKTYQRKLRKMHPEKDPIYYIRMEQDEKYKQVVLIYDWGNGERKVAPKLEVKKSEAEQAIEAIPDNILAQALKFSSE